MTTLQPRLVRADTLDLQSHDSPSAQDHTRSPTFTPYQHGQTGSHHREALRNAEDSAYHDRRLSTGVSVDDPSRTMTGHSHLYDSADESADEEHHDGNNAGSQQDDSFEQGDGDEEQDDDLDDDMSDKISSSPSIEDGNYSRSIWPPRLDSMGAGVIPAPASLPIRGSCSVPYPAPCSQNMFLAKEVEVEIAHHQHQSGGYEPAFQVNIIDSPSTGKKDSTVDAHDKENKLQLVGHTLPRSELSVESLSKYLLPTHDPFLEDDMENEDGHEDKHNHDDADNEADWIDEDICIEDDSSVDDKDDDDDDPDDICFTCDSRFIDSGWGGECLRETEDIDFEFVYALHTFVATVEGQANATKGDTMVLLDDSNSYWWLVRVVKDGSIGYLPAEHIETPTERLARLNKHRNIDLSATMLGDNPEKPKNPLKKAMRRRNAKSVAFAAPTYYEPSIYSYSSDEEGEDGDEIQDDIQHAEQSQQQEDSNAARVNNKEAIAANGIAKVAEQPQVIETGANSPVKSEALDPGDLQAQQEENMQRSRNGVVRNTDSFFKDDTVETKKISLTPRLLRNDVESTPAAEPVRERASIDATDRLSTDEKKDDKKKKEKKGMLSSLFKRKDKKSGKGEGDDTQAPEEQILSPSSKTLLDAPQSPERKPGKLQKSPKLGSTKSASIDTTSPVVATSPTMASNTASIHSPQASISGGTPGLVNPNATQKATVGSPAPEPSTNTSATAVERSAPSSTLTAALRSTAPAMSDSRTEVKPFQTKKSKEHFAIDTSDSEDESTPRATMVSQYHRSISPMRDSMLAEQRPDSAMQVSPIESAQGDYSPGKQGPFGHAAEMTGADNVTPIDPQPRSDTASTSKPSPSLATHTPSTSRSTPTWSDASLRSYMENDQDIRDLLIIVHDKSNVTPVGSDHPLMGGLFMTERTRLAEMQTQLDSMLTGWISKKNPGLMVK